MDDAPAPESPHGQVALAFARALAAGDFETAHRMLSPTLRDEWPPGQLQREYEQMFSYAGETKATGVELADTWEDWPGKQDADIGGAYVSIIGPNAVFGGDWVEAVAVTVEDNNGRPLIREIIWGRP
jgi:hypothetical protein